MLQGIGLAVAVACGVSVPIGLLLGLASRLFAVKTDERLQAVREALPGNNCGGCGYAGCDALAEAVVRGDAPTNACPVGGAAVAARVAEIMGTAAGDVQRRVAYVHCAGTCDAAKRDYHYFGAPDCRQAAMAPGHAGKACAWACFGLGTCAAVCPADAIRLADGIAVVDADKCISCAQCVAVCPQHIIAMRPDSAKIEVRCSSHAFGKAVKAVCSAGCIGCGICQRVCPHDAIRVTDALARVDHEKCTGCGKCVEKCPVKIIRVLRPEAMAPED